MSLPRMIITGASGFIGRHLLDGLKDDYEIIGLARRSQARCGAPVHANIQWRMIDIGDAENLALIFDEIREGGPVDIVLHLAAHYDFTGENHPEYWRTNVEGLRNVLEQCRALKPRRFIFSSSVAACQFPRPGTALDERSVPDGDHIYAKTKALGEQMLGEYSKDFPSVIVRFAALFSDWCEYPPLYMFLRTWLSKAWNSRVLGGKGESAIPYMHVNECTRFIRHLLRWLDDIADGEILLASPDGSISHKSLFLESTEYYFEQPRSPWLIPRVLVYPGILATNLFGRLLNEPPFERPWMARYVDLKLTVDASHTRDLLRWEPRERLELKRRLPFLLEHLKGDRMEWTRRNRDAMKRVRIRPCIRIYGLLQKHRDEIIEASSRILRTKFLSYARVDGKELEWNHKVFMRHLFNAVRTRERVDFLSYCKELAERRHELGYTMPDVVGAMETINRICVSSLTHDPEAKDMLPYLHQHLVMTMRFGIDQMQETFEDLNERARDRE